MRGTCQITPCSSRSCWMGKLSTSVCCALQMQRADAQDARLQQEWGEILAAQGRSTEAATHLSAAAALLTQQLAEAPQILAVRLQALLSARLPLEQRALLCAVQGIESVLSTFDMAMGCLHRALELNAEGSCMIHARQCEAHGQLARTLRSFDHHRAAAAAASAQMCVQRLQTRPECSSLSQF